MRPLITLLAALLVVTSGSAALAAPRQDRAREVTGRIDLTATVQTARGHDGTCRVTADVTTLDGTLQDGQGLTGDGRVEVVYPCTSTPDRGAHARLVADVTLRVQTTAGGNPEGRTVRPRPARVIAVHDWITVEVSTTAGGNPEGFRANLNVATTAGGNPEG